MTLTYVYCIVRSGRRPARVRMPRRMPGAADITVAEAGDGRWLIVSHVPEAEYGEAALARGLQDLDWVAARALAHEAVVEQFLAARAVLPMKLFTLFTSDERALSYVSRHRRRIDRVLTRVERQHEWGVRLTFQESARRASGSARTETGAGYLARKRELLDLDRARLVDARTHGNRAYTAMAREATAARRRPATERSTPGSRLIVDAAFLVPVARTAAFRAAIRRQARDLGAAGLSVALTGPWPPYNFIDSAGRRA